jgi:hypothetical protein
VVAEHQLEEEHVQLLAGQLAELVQLVRGRHARHALDLAGRPAALTVAVGVGAALAHPLHVARAGGGEARLDPHREPAGHLARLGQLRRLDVERDALQGAVGRAVALDAGHGHGLEVVDTHVLREADVNRRRAGRHVRAAGPRVGDDHPAGGADQEHGDHRCGEDPRAAGGAAERGAH